jgi:hypothetical protein
MKVFDVVFENKADELARKILAKSDVGTPNNPIPAEGRSVDDIVAGIRSRNSALHAEIKAGMVHDKPQKAYFEIFAAITRAAKKIADREIEAQGLTGGDAMKLYREIEKKVISAANAWMVNYYNVSVGPGTTTKEIVFTHKQGS